MNKESVLDLAKALLKKDIVSLSPFAQRLSNLGTVVINAVNFSKHELLLNNGEVFIGKLILDYRTNQDKPVFLYHEYKGNGDNLIHLSNRSIPYGDTKSAFDNYSAAFSGIAEYEFSDNWNAVDKKSIYTFNSLGEVVGEYPENNSHGFSSLRVFDDVCLNYIKAYAFFHPTAVDFRINLVGYIAR